MKASTATSNAPVGSGKLSTSVTASGKSPWRERKHAAGSVAADDDGVRGSPPQVRQQSPDTGANVNHPLRLSQW